MRRTVSNIWFCPRSFRYRDSLIGQLNKLSQLSRKLWVVKFIQSWLYRWDKHYGFCPRFPKSFRSLDSLIVQLGDVTTMIFDHRWFWVSTIRHLSNVKHASTMLLWSGSTITKFSSLLIFDHGQEYFHRRSFFSLARAKIHYWELGIKNWNISKFW